MNSDFWTRCVDAGCVIVPVKAYSKYGADGNNHEEFFEGLKFAAINVSDNEPTGPDYWFMVDDCHAGPLFDSPEAALEAYLTKADEAPKAPQNPPQPA